MNSMAAVGVQPAMPTTTAAADRIPWGFPELFIISQTALPALLYLPGSQSFRLPLRFSAFGISLAAFAWWQIQSEQSPPAHRAYGWVAAVMGLLGIVLWSPYTASLMAGVAEIGVYLAVMSPLFWA